MEHPCKLQSTWFAFISKLISFVRVLKKVSLLWHYPFAFVFFLLLFTSPMQPIIRFFFPLTMCTLLCIIAFIGFSSLMDKSRESQRHGCEIACIDVLGLGGGWPAFDGSQFHSIFKQEGDLNPLMEEMKSKTTIQTKNEVSDVDQQGGDIDSSLKKEIEPEKEGTWVSEIYDKLHPDTSINPSSFSEGAVKRERKTHVKFKDEILVIDEQGRDEDRSFQMYDHDDADIKHEDGGLSSPTEEMQKSQSYGQIKDVNSTLDEQGQDGVRDSGFQQDSNSKSEDGLCSVTEKIEEIAQLEDRIAGTDVAFNINQQLQLDSNSKHEYNIQHEVDTKIQIQGKLDCMDVLHREQNLAVELYHEFQTNSSSKYEDNHLKQELDSEFQIKGKVNGVNVLVHGENLAPEMHDKLQLDNQTNKEGDTKPEIESKVQMEDKMYGMVVLSHELQPYRSSKEEGVSKQDSDFAPQKWRDWVGGVETDGLGTWSLEKGIFRIANEKTILTDFDAEFTGVATKDEEFINGGAFIAEDENGGTLLLEVSAYIQEVSVKLQDVGGFEAELDQPIGLIVSADQEGLEPLCTVNDIRELMLGSFSHRFETIDDFHTEEGDESSRWDEALDTTEKESMDSENEVGMIWSSTTDVTELGEPITEEEFQALKQKYRALEKEFKALQGEISLKSLEQNSGTRKTEEYDQDSDDSLDPYIRLFAESASDAEDKVQNPPHQSLKFSRKIPSKIGNNSRENTISSSLDTKAFLRKPLLCGINRVIRAIRGKRL